MCRRRSFCGGPAPFGDGRRVLTGSVFLAGGGFFFTTSLFFTVRQNMGDYTTMIGTYLVDQHNGILYKQNTVSGQYERQSFRAEM